MSDEIKAGYGFTICPPDDPERTARAREDGGGFHWYEQQDPPCDCCRLVYRKPIPAPDGKRFDDPRCEWELVPEDSDFVPEDRAAMFFVINDQAWMPLCNDERPVRYWAKESCIAKQTSGIARRKSPKADGWVYFKDRKPTEKDLPIVATKTDGRVSIFSAKQNWYDALKFPPESMWFAWRSIGPLPEPPKTPFQKAEEAYNKEERAFTAREHRQYFFDAGYTAGKETK